MMSKTTTKVDEARKVCNEAWTAVVITGKAYDDAYKAYDDIYRAAIDDMIAKAAAVNDAYKNYMAAKVAATKADDVFVAAMIATKGDDDEQNDDKNR